MAGKYVRVGLRRDKNFSDLENTYTSLGNLLNNLAPPGKSFIPEDIQVINNVSEDSNVTNDNFLELLGVTKTATQIRYRTSIEFSSEFDTLPFSAGIAISKGGVEVFFESLSTAIPVFDNQTETYTYFYDAVVLTDQNFVPFSLDEQIIIFNAVIKITEINITQETLDNFVVEPSITIKDAIENIKVITGTPPYLAGGNGLNAKFYGSTQITTEAQRTASTSGYELFNYNEAFLGGAPGFYYGPFNFWESGYFGFGPSIYDSTEFINGFGGVQWEGYFAPIPFIVANNIRVSTSGLIIIEEDVNDNDNWQKILNIYSKDRSVSVNAISATTANILSISASDIIKIGINDTVKTTTADGDIFGSGIKVDDIDYNTGEVRLSDAINLDAGSNTIVFNFGVGVEDITATCTSVIAGLNVKRKLRISLFWPEDVGYDSFRKRCSFAYLQQSTTQAPASFFYSDGDAIAENTDVNSFEYFYNNYINLGNENTTEALQINDQSIIKYDPPLTVSSKITSLGNILYFGNGLFLGATIEKGQRILISKGNSIFLGQVEASSTDQNGFFISAEYIDNYNSGLGPAEQLLADDSVSAWLIDTVGLVDVFIRYSNGDSFASLLGNVNPDRIAKDQLMFSMHEDFSTYGPVVLTGKTFSQATSTYSFTFNDYFSGGYADFLNNTTDDKSILFLYKDKGLEDLSKVDFCQGVIGHLITVESAIGSNTIVLDDVSDVQPGYYIQFKGFVPAGTTITNVNSGTNTITISNAITKALRQDYTITIVPGNPGSENYEICVLPLDTAPPFTGTDAGLKTATGIENLSTNELLFDRLKIKGIVDSPIGNQEYSKTMDVTFDNNSGVRKVYKLMVF